MLAVICVPHFSLSEGAMAFKRRSKLFCVAACRLTQQMSAL